jgi:hypothetical protein
LYQGDDHDALLAGQKNNQHPGFHSKSAGVKIDVLNENLEYFT